MSAVDRAVEVLRAHTGCLGVLPDSAVKHVMSDLAGLLVTEAVNRVVEAAKAETDAENEIGRWDRVRQSRQAAEADRALRRARAARAAAVRALREDEA